MPEPITVPIVISTRSANPSVRRSVAGWSCDGHRRCGGASSTCGRTVSDSIISVSTSTPMPGAVGTCTMPSASIVHSGETTSRAQYRALGLRSPGSEKFGSDASATLYARPMPLSSMPPHQTGMPARAADVVDRHRRASSPPTRPGLMLTMRPLPSAIMSSARSTPVIDSSRQIGVDIRRWSAAWRTRSSSPSGCSSMIRSNASSCARWSASASVYAEFASAMRPMSGPIAARTARTYSTSRPGWIFTLILR